MHALGSHKSYFDSNAEITQAIWATTLICDSTRCGRPSSSGSNHAALIIEGVKKSGEFFRKIVHLTGPCSTDKPSPVVFRGSCCTAGMLKIGNVKISDITNKPAVLYTHKSETWLRSAEKVNQLLHQAELEKDRPFEFPKPFFLEIDLYSQET